MITKLNGHPEREREIKVQFEQCLHVSPYYEYTLMYSEHTAFIQTSVIQGNSKNGMNRYISLTLRNKVGLCGTHPVMTWSQ